MPNEGPRQLAEITAAVGAANDRLSRPEQVKRFRVLPSGWTPESGELTPTLKLRRRIVQERHADAIGSLYDDPPSSPPPPRPVPRGW